VSSLQFNIVLGGSRDCAAISRPIFAGTMQGPNTISAEATDVVEPAASIGSRFHAVRPAVRPG
jgi:hypothetical protein